MSSNPPTPIAGERSDVHNSSVDESAAAHHQCDATHLATGHGCLLPDGHVGTGNALDVPQQRPRPSPYELFKCLALAQLASHHQQFVAQPAFGIGGFGQDSLRFSTLVVERRKRFTNWARLPDRGTRCGFEALPDRSM